MDEGALYELRARAEQADYEIEELQDALHAATYEAAQMRKLIGAMRAITKDVGAGVPACVMKVQGRAVSPATVEPYIHHAAGITWLQVPFSEKEAAKAKGAQWNGDKKKWYVPPGSNLTPFRKWNYGSRIELSVPFEKFDTVRELGAKWDTVNMVWFVTDNMETAAFRRWMPASPARSSTSAQDVDSPWTHGKKRANDEEAQE